MVVLLYHGIADNGAGDGLISADGATLDQQIGTLAAHCEVITPADLSDELLSRSDRHVIVTFDDCYRNNYDVALPILRSHRVNATFFIASGFLDGTATPWWDEIEWMVRSSRGTELQRSEWWPDRLPLTDDAVEETITTIVRSYRGCPPARSHDLLEHVAKATGSGRRPSEDVARQFVTWEMAREMASAGMTIGAHTASHPVLSTLTEDAQRREIETSIERIGRELGARPDTFAYPVGVRGTFDDATKRAAAAAGVRTAFSNYGGYTTSANWDRLDVRRIPIGLETSMSVFRWIVALPAVFARR